MNSITYVLILIGIITMQLASCQSKLSASKKVDYKNNPEWIKMMHAEQGVNYFETVKAYEEYWKDREEPREEEELEKSTEGKESAKDVRHSKSEREDSESSKYSLEYKRYQTWKTEVLPYVQSDGTILSKEERLKLHETQRP